MMTIGTMPRVLFGFFRPQRRFFSKPAWPQEGQERASTSADPATQSRSETKDMEPGRQNCG